MRVDREGGKQENEIEILYIVKSIGTMESVCRLVRTSGNQEDECELVNARSVHAH